MAPLYLGYAALGGKISPLLLEHYRLMARSGAALIVVENSGITRTGSGSPRTLRCDHEQVVPQLLNADGMHAQGLASSSLAVRENEVVTDISCSARLLTLTSLRGGRGFLK